MAIAHSYHLAIAWLTARAGGPDKFLHTHVGLLIWVVATVALRRTLGSLTPLAVLLAIELGNELLDRLYMGKWMWSDTFGDIVATLAWPLMLTFLLRWRRSAPADRLLDPEHAAIAPRDHPDRG